MCKLVSVRLRLVVGVAARQRTRHPLDISVCPTRRSTVPSGVPKAHQDVYIAPQFHQVSIFRAVNAVMNSQFAADGTTGAPGGGGSRGIPLMREAGRQQALEKIIPDASLWPITQIQVIVWALQRITRPISSVYFFSRDYLLSVMERIIKFCLKNGTLGSTLVWMRARCEDQRCLHHQLRIRPGMNAPSWAPVLG